MARGVLQGLQRRGSGRTVESMGRLASIFPPSIAGSKGEEEDNSRCGGGSRAGNSARQRVQIPPEAQTRAGARPASWVYNFQGCRDLRRGNHVVANQKTKEGFVKPPVMSFSTSRYGEPVAFGVFIGKARLEKGRKQAERLQQWGWTGRLSPFGSGTRRRRPSVVTE